MAKKPRTPKKEPLPRWYRGACKQVIGRRLKQTGARWKVRRVERMAALCAVQASGQWDDYWEKAAGPTA